MFGSWRRAFDANHNILQIAKSSVHDLSEVSQQHGTDDHEQSKAHADDSNPYFRLFSWISITNHHSAENDTRAIANNKDSKPNETEQ